MVLRILKSLIVVLLFPVFYIHYISGIDIAGFHSSDNCHQFEYRSRFVSLAYSKVITLSIGVGFFV